MLRQRNDQEMCSAVPKELWFADTQESFFEASKGSQLCCPALLCGRFADSQENGFLASKRWNMDSAVLEGGRSADIHEFCF